MPLRPRIDAARAGVGAIVPDVSGVRAGTLEAPTVQVELEVEPAANHELNRRRFTIAACIALGLALIPYLWVLWNGRFDPLRTAWPNGLASNFYDVQARALMHGHWDVPKGSLGIEAYVVDGRDYMFFGPFPAILRMPVLAITDRFDGELTALSLLLSWLVTGLFSALLLWRVRILLRGQALLGRAEATALGVLLATITSGTVLLYLAELPWVYHEDFAWGAALAIAALFALLGALERPSAGRIVATGVLILLTLLTRVTLGWGCVLGAILAAVWFATGRGGESNRRWWLPLLAAAVIPFAIGCVINFIKFGIPFGVDMYTQEFTRVNAHRRYVLAENGGRLWTPRFVPSTVWAYLRPDGLRLTAVFPFISLPASPARGVGGAVLDQTYRTASMTASMPLLFIFGVYGVVTACRRRTVGQSNLTRIPLVAAAAGTAAVFVWGYIHERYLTEFIPFLVLASAIGLISVWYRGRRSRWIRVTALTTVLAAAFFSVAANLLIVNAPTDPVAWQGKRAQDYVQLQESTGKLTGQTLDDNVIRGKKLPPKWAPADKLFVWGRCTSMHISTGEFDNTWVPVEYGRDAAIRLRMTFHKPPRAASIPLVTVRENQSSTVYLQTDRARRMRFRVEGHYGFPNFTARDRSGWIPLRTGETYRITVVADPVLQRFSVALNDYEMVNGFLNPVDRQVTPWLRGPAPDRAGIAVTVTKDRAPKPSLCLRLIGAEKS